MLAHTIRRRTHGSSSTNIGCEGRREHWSSGTTRVVRGLFQELLLSALAMVANSACAVEL